MAATIIGFQSQAIEPVEFRDAFQPSILPGFETLVVLPTLEEIPANLSPAPRENDLIGMQPRPPLIGGITIADQDRSFLRLAEQSLRGLGAAGRGDEEIGAVLADSRPEPSAGLAPIPSEILDSPARFIPVAHDRFVQPFGDRLIDRIEQPLEMGNAIGQGSVRHLQFFSSQPSGRPTKGTQANLGFDEEARSETHAVPSAEKQTRNRRNDDLVHVLLTAAGRFPTATMDDVLVNLNPDLYQLGGALSVTNLKATAARTTPFRFGWLVRFAHFFNLQTFRARMAFLAEPRSSFFATFLWLAVQFVSLLVRTDFLAAGRLLG